MLNKQYTFKILVIGDSGTGKTSIIRRFVHDVFTSNYKATIGVDFAMKKITTEDDVQVYLQIWDISDALFIFLFVTCYVYSVYNYIRSWLASWLCPKI